MASRMIATHFQLGKKMAVQLTAPTFTSFPIYPPHFSKANPISAVSLLFRRRERTALTLTLAFPRRRGRMASCFSPQQVEEGRASSEEEKGGDWGKVSAVLFDMDGVLCNSEEPSRMAAVDVFAEMGVLVTADDFVPFMGTGEANFLGGVASVKGVTDFDTEKAKKRFFEIYLDKYAKPNSGIGFPGALELIMQCKSHGLKVAVASSADRIKVDANLAAASLLTSIFDAIVSADAFENLKPAPDIFFAASKSLNVHPSEIFREHIRNLADSTLFKIEISDKKLFKQCLVIEDALAGVHAAKAAEMRCIAVTTTLSEEKMQRASPSLIRKNIGNISIHDILDGGHPDKKMQNPQNINSLEHTSSELLNEKVAGFSARYGSLGIAVSRLLFTITYWKAMQYASLNGILNLFSEANRPIFGHNEARSKFDVEIEPANAVNIEPRNGMINSDGSASLHFRRTSSLPATGRINCKVYHCKEDEVCLYQPLAFDVLFQQEVPDSNPTEISFSDSVTPKVPSGASKLSN